MIASPNTLPLSAPDPVTKRSENRRDNLRKLIEEHDGPLALAKLLGYKNASFLVQMAGPSPTREVTEKSARSFEIKLGLEEGSLDWVPEKGKAKPARGASAAAPAADTVEVVKLMARVCSEQNVMLPPVKFADAVAFVIESGAEPTSEFLAKVLALINK